MVEGGQDLSRVDRRERAQLNEIGRSAPHARLACQTVIGIARVTIVIGDLPMFPVKTS